MSKNEICIAIQNSFVPFGDAKVERLFGPEKASNLVVEDPVEGFGYLLKILLKIPLFAAP